MNQLFRSAPVVPATPEQAFTSQASQLQRQLSQGRASNGAVLNNRPVPLELSSNLLPLMPAGGHLALSSNGVAQANTPSTAAQAQATKLDPDNTPDRNALAQKMIDALNKYEQLKKQEKQGDNAERAEPARLDLAL